MKTSAEKIGIQSLGIIGKILKYLGLGAGVVIGLLIIISIFNIALPLNFLKKTIQETVQNSTNRNIQISGDIGLIPGLSPTLSIEQTTLENPDSFENRTFVSIGEISAQIHLIPLLRKKIHIGQVLVDKVMVNLIQPVEEDPNWVFNPPNKSQKTNQDSKPETTEQEESENTSNSINVTGFDELKVSGISLAFHNLETQSKQELKLETAIVRAAESQPITLKAVGSFNTLPFILNARTVNVSELMKLNLPLDFQANANVGELELSVDARLVKQGVQLTTEIIGTDLAELNEPLGLALPALKKYQVSTKVHYAGTELMIDMLNVAFDDSVITGSAALNHGTSPISLSGQIDIESLNLDPFLESVDDSDSAKNAADEADSSSKTKSKDLSGLVDRLARYTVDFGINVKELKAGGAFVSHSSLQINLDKGVLDTPLSINFNGIPLQGNLSLSGKDRVINADAYLEVENNDIQDLEQWFKLDGIDGSLGKFSIEATTSGDSIPALISALTTKLEITKAELRYGDISTGQDVPFTLDSLHANVAGNSPLIIEASGQLLKENFSLNLEGGKLKQLARSKEWPITVNASGAGANLVIDGFIRKPGETTGSKLQLALSGAKLGDMHRWLGLEKNTEAAYNINATAETHNDGWKVENLDIDFGNTAIDGAISATESESGKLFQVNVTSSLIDIPEITSFFPVVEKGLSVSEKNGETKIDESTAEINPDELRKSVETALKIPILPGGVELPDSNIDVNLNELKMDSISIMDIGFTGSMRNGVLDSSPFSMNLGGTRFSGSIGFDSISSPARANLVLETHDINIGDFLTAIQISEEINANASLLQLQFDLEGHSLGNILSNSTVKAKIREGQWILGEPGGHGELVMEVVKGDFIVAPGKSVTTILDVLIKGEPVTITVTSDNPTTRKERANANVQIDLQYLDNALTLAGYTPLPLNLNNLNLDLKLNGKNLGSLSKLAGMRIPEVGPYKFVGNFVMRKEGYFVDKLKTEFGESILSGTAKYRIDSDVPEFEVLLVSDRLQLNDFKLDDKKSDTKIEAADQNTNSTESQEISNPVTGASEESPRFTAESLGMANGRFNLKVKEVVSGEDWLGEGEINITLQDSHIDFNPIQLKLPGGKFDASVSLFPEDQMIRSEINARIDKFNYGILARRAKPETTMSGLIYLDVKLDSQAKYLDKMMANAYGHIDFLLLPEEFEAGIIDLWASNLVVAMLPKIGTNVSLINCVIAKFNIEDGLMTEEDLYLDTSKLRAIGKGEINFKDETISYVLKPKAKNAGFFQAQAPIKIEGEFSDLGFSLDGGLIGTALRMAATTYTVPIRMLMGNNVPKDGSDICIPLVERKRQQDQN
jgi:uncharacterized protein involved in outer membrane biogenesis